MGEEKEARKANVPFCQSEFDHSGGVPPHWLHACNSHPRNYKPRSKILGSNSKLCCSILRLMLLPYCRPSSPTHTHVYLVFGITSDTTASSDSGLKNAPFSPPPPKAISNPPQISFLLTCHVSTSPSFFRPCSFTLL